MEQMKYFMTVIIIFFCAFSIINQADVNPYFEQKDIKELADQAGDNAISDKWCECDLPPEDWPDYYFFTNAQQRHYNLSLENEVAFAVKDYAMEVHMENEKWELEQIYYWRDDIYQAYVESDMGSELCILLKTNTPAALPHYIIAADVHKGDDVDTILSGEYSYNSMLEWHSYQEWFDGKKREEQVQVDVMGDIHDSIYNNAVLLAIYDYVNLTDGDKKSLWKIDGNSTYIGRNGYIVCANCSNTTQNIIFFVDVWNKTYAVMGTSK